MKIIGLLQNILSPLQNCEDIAFKYCRLLNIPATKNFIKVQLEEHPDFPSLLSISDILKSYGVENFSIKITNERLFELPAPIIVQLNYNDEKYFGIVIKLNSNTVTYYHPLKKRNITTSLNEFKQVFTGIALVGSPLEGAGEMNYKANHRRERKDMLIKTLVAIFIPFFTFISASIALINYGLLSIPSILYAFFTLMGSISCSLLLWLDVDQYNPLLQQICSAGRKTNCEAIVHSNGSKIFGMSWSSIGFIYFVGSLINLLISGIYNSSILFILSWLNLISLPYIIYSIYYQARIARQWCPLCLVVLLSLTLQFLAAFIGGFHSGLTLDRIKLTPYILPVLFSFIIPFFVITLLLPALKGKKEGELNRTDFIKLKHNPLIYNALIATQKKMIKPPDGLGIIIGKADAKYQLTKVCNPYCPPCARAHTYIEKLIENNPELKVQIIYNSTGEPNDIRTLPVVHLLAIASEENEPQTIRALDDWYLAKKKDYDLFAEKYPMSEELTQQDDKIKEMFNWCKSEGVMSTPTFFINGYQLPSLYRASDLQYLLCD